MQGSVGESVRSPRAFVALGAAFAVLVLGFVRLPVQLAALCSPITPRDQHGIIALLVPAVVASWGSSDAEPTADLLALEGYWMRFHLFKAAFAMAATVVIVLLGRALWRAGHVWGAALLAAPGLLGLVALLANLQGAVAPGPSLQSMLPLTRDGSLGAVLLDVRADLARQGSGVVRSVRVDRLITDFALYHWVFAALSSVTAVVLAVALLRWRHTPAPSLADARSARRARRVLLIGGALSSLAWAVLCVANLSNALHPVSGLLGWLRL